MSSELLDTYAPMMTQEELESPIAETIAALYHTLEGWKKRVKMAQDDDKSFYEPQIGELKQLLQAARTYMTHFEYCMRYNLDRCDCGYTQLIRKIESIAAENQAGQAAQ